MTLEELTDRLREDFPDWDQETALHVARRIDAVAMEATTERELDQLPTFGTEDNMTLDERVSTRTMALLLAAKEHQVDQLIELVKSYETLVASQAETIRKREEEVAALLTLFGSERVVPALDETWRQERNGRFL